MHVLPLWSILITVFLGIGIAIFYAKYTDNAELITDNRKIIKVINLRNLFSDLCKLATRLQCYCNELSLCSGIHLHLFGRCNFLLCRQNLLLRNDLNVYSSDFLLLLIKYYKKHIGTFLNYFKNNFMQIKLIRKNRLYSLLIDRLNFSFECKENDSQLKIRFFVSDILII